MRLIFASQYIIIIILNGNDNNYTNNNDEVWTEQENKWIYNWTLVVCVWIWSIILCYIEKKCKNFFGCLDIII